MIAHDAPSPRTLWSRDDRAALGAHLLRLGPEDRRRRFHGLLSDAAIAAHAARAFGPGRHALGWHDRGALRAAAELALTGDAVEIALTVEAPWRRRGVGRALLLRGIEHAASRGARRLVMHVAQENGAMIALARACGAQIAAEGPEVSGLIATPRSRPFRLMFDLAKDEAVLAGLMMRAPGRIWRRAAGA